MLLQTIFCIDSPKYREIASYSKTLKLFETRNIPSSIPDSLYKTIIITSKRAIHPLTLQNQSSRIYCIGKSIQEELLKSNIKSRGFETGNALELANLVIKENDYIDSRLILLLNGDKRLDTLPNMLSNAGIPFKEICVSISIFIIGY